MKVYRNVKAYRVFACFSVILVMALLCAACGKMDPGRDGPFGGTGSGGTISNGTASGGSGSNGSGSGAAASGENVPGGTTPEGIWYEQAEYANILEISADTIRFTRYDGSYTTEEKCRFVKNNGVVLIETEDYFIYEDMSYDPQKDIVAAYTMSHTDGDGGHNYSEFRRTAYVPPPPPVYGPAADNSDPDAVRDFGDLTIRSMKVSFYDEGTPYDVSSSMAQQPPFAGNYSYDLEVLEDGTGLVSSSFCQEIELSKETVDELQQLARECDLGKINGVDIHTDGLPYGSPEYEAEIGLASGEVIRSSANGDSVPEQWQSFQEPMHRLLFFAFVDAGYNYNGGQFHSTKPMKRVRASNRTYRENTGIRKESEYIVPDWKKAYDYTLDTQYFKFSDPENRYPALMRTLDELSATYRQIAEEELRKDYEMMEKVPKSVWKKKDRRYCYSLYAVDNWELNNNIFSFTVSEGHSNSLGVGESGYGKYDYIWYHIDVNTGEILTLGDLFEDAGSAGGFISSQMAGRYGTHNDEGKRVHADDFPAAVDEAVRKSGKDGIGWTIGYDGLTLWMPLSMFPSADSHLMEIIYYDELQDLLGDKYTEIW